MKHTKTLTVLAITALGLFGLSACSSTSVEPTPTPVQVATINGCGGVLANPDGTCIDPSTPAPVQVAEIHGCGGVLADPDGSCVDLSSSSYPVVIGTISGSGGVLSGTTPTDPTLYAGAADFTLAAVNGDQITVQVDVDGTTSCVTNGDFLKVPSFPCGYLNETAIANGGRIVTHAEVPLNPVFANGATYTMQTLSGEVETFNIDVYGAVTTSTNGGELTFGGIYHA